MNKAMFVSDMPMRCEGCDYCNSVLGTCKFVGDVDLSIDNGGRDLRCPFKPLPKRRLVVTHYSNEIMVNGIEYAFSRGWNDCLDEIIKEGFIWNKE